MRLTAFALLLAAAVSNQILASERDHCATSGWTGNCAASTSDGVVNVSGTRPDPGAPPRHDRARGESAPQDDDVVECDNPLNRCETYEVVMRPDPTLTDVASFAPTLPRLAPEPDGVGVAGLPLNVIARAEPHTATGELFDIPVSVRFRPVSYVFDYGDGTVRETDAGGAPWDALGAAQFTATDTSHAYRYRGTYTITATVHFTADVDFGTGWQRVPGLLGIPAGSTTVDIVEAHTALVERTCDEDPNGIGC